MSDQKAKADAGKLQLTLVPRQIIRDIAVIRMYGNAKYSEGGVDNWKNVEPERFRDAAFRHFLAYLDDPTSVDKESGYPHLWHLACNVGFLCEMEHRNFMTAEQFDEILKKVDDSCNECVHNYGDDWNTCRQCVCHDLFVKKEDTK